MLFLQSNGDKSQPELHESVSPCVASPESQYSFSRVLGDVAGKKNDVLNDGANPAPPDLSLRIQVCPGFCVNSKLQRKTEQ